MQAATNLLLIGVVLLALGALAADRTRTRTSLVALQGAALGGLLLTRQWDRLHVHLLVVATLSIAVKALIAPRMLVRADRLAGGSGVEIKPYIGPVASLLLGAAAIVVGFSLGSVLKLPHPVESGLIVPVSLSTLFMGLLVLVGKKSAISQVLGYLVMENGIFVFGLALADAIPTVVEMGVLLDLFVAVFIMRITIYHISREFDHIDSSQLRTLREGLDNTQARRGAE